jgi:hypothetical protein
MTASYLAALLRAVICQVATAMRHARKVLQRCCVAEDDNLVTLTLLGQVLGVTTLDTSLVHLHSTTIAMTFETPEVVVSIPARFMPSKLTRYPREGSDPNPLSVLASLSLKHTSLIGVEPMTYRLGGGRSSSEL